MAGDSVPLEGRSEFSSHANRAYHFVQRSAEYEAVVDAVGIVVCDERLKRGDFSHEITDHDSPVRRLGAAYSNRHPGRRDRVIRDYDNGAISPERYRRLSSGALVRLVWWSPIARRHDPGSKTQYCRFDSRPTLSASSFVA